VRAAKTLNYDHWGNARMKGTESRKRNGGTGTRFAVFALVFGISCLFAEPALAAVDAVDPMADATYVGEKVCIKCHQVENTHFTFTQHAKAFRQNPKSEAEKQVCEACHGPGSKHVPEADNKKREFLIGFTKEWGTPVEKQTGACLTCHQRGQRIHWPGSTHDLNKVSCSDCHNPMARFSASGLLKKASIAQTCETCHPQQRSEFDKRSHMPVHEGKMSCEDCHNPHGSDTKPLLKAETVNEVCYACHAEKRGPFLWEHAPVRENCMNCHLPHGSNHDKLLAAARPYLCSQCHDPAVGHPGQFFRADQTAGAALVGGTQSARVIGRSCQNCHTQIHGSNHPSGARFQR
jgi:DmsE family decaheme c-type cytochrome